MKLLILALALLVPITSHAADDAARYAAVESAVPGATVVKRDLQGYSSEGGQLTAYFQKGVPIKLTAKYYGESGQATEEYYFSRGRLFFILRTSRHYAEPLGAGANSSAPPKLVRDEAQERWYFTNGELKRWLRPNGKTVVSGGEFDNQQENYLALAREFLVKARGKSKIVKEG